MFRDKSHPVAKLMGSVAEIIQERCQSKTELLANNLKEKSSLGNMAYLSVKQECLQKIRDLELRADALARVPPSECIPGSREVPLLCARLRLGPVSGARG